MRYYVLVFGSGDNEMLVEFWLKLVYAHGLNL